MKRALTLLLLAAVCGPALANPPACGAPVVDYDRDVLTRAEQAVAAARTAPGPQMLTLADALADLAEATARKPGGAAKRTSGAGAVPGALDILAQAQAIWTKAQPDAALAKALWTRGRRHLVQNQCAMALGVLETALEVAEKSGAGASPVATFIARDLVLVAIAIGDDPTLNTVAPRLVATLETDAAPFAADSFDAYLAILAYYYKTEDNARGEQLAARLLERARAAKPENTEAVRRLTYELASFYYAQLRYKEAEALMSPVFRPVAVRRPYAVDFKRVEAEMAALVRAGRLKEALAAGEEALARYEPGRANSVTALAAAQAALDALPASATTELPPARARTAEAMREASAWQLALAQVQGYAGEVRHALGQYEQALALYQKSLANYANPSGPNFYDAVRIRSDMALLYRARGDAARALAIQQQVRKELLPMVGAAHPDLLEAEAEIAALHLALKDYAAAAPLYAQRLERAERDKAPPAAIAAILEAQLAIARGQGDTAGAAALQRRLAATTPARAGSATLKAPGRPPKRVH